MFLQYFNSIKVRLEQQKQKLASARKNYFNSIKVRLEQEAGLNPNLMMKFQFHKGAIRTTFSSTSIDFMNISIP